MSSSKKEELTDSQKYRINRLRVSRIWLYGGLYLGGLATAVSLLLAVPSELGEFSNHFRLADPTKILDAITCIQSFGFLAFLLGVSRYLAD